jgi:hydrogenase expression/formation protein HypE
MNDDDVNIGNFSCPLPMGEYDFITMAHGGGGKIMNNLIDKMFMKTFSNNIIQQKHDGAIFEIGKQKFAFTTDSYVVNPIFFPGGDIGELAVYGTVNDLSMCGAIPLFLSLAIIMEEGFPVKDLEKIVNSIRKATDTANVKIITGDTKVVEKGKGDGIFINTSGIGIINEKIRIFPQNIKKGDLILLNGDIGRHGTAIMTSRENLDIESNIKSDCAPLNGIVKRLIDEDIEIHCLRDLTRGGLGSALNEIATQTELEIEIDGKEINVIEEVKGICEILGIDPIHIANEGRFIAFVAKDDAEKALKILRKEKVTGKYASIIGIVKDRYEKGIVTLKSITGAKRILDMLSGEQLPRIC